MSTETALEFLAEQKRLAEAQAFAHSEMLAIGRGVGGLGVRSPELFEDMMSWSDATENDHADTALRLIAALEAVLAEADAYDRQPDVMEPCGAVAQSIRAAIEAALSTGRGEK